MINIRRILFFFLCLFMCFSAFPALAQQGELERAEELNQKVLELYRQGRYTEAIPIAREVLAITEKASGPKHP